MAVRVGQACIDENGKSTGGKAGNQKNELRITNWKKNTKTWYLYRFEEKDGSRNVANRIALAVERACQNRNIGYDQNQRNTLYNHVKDKGFDPGLATKAVETDCSALIRVCVAYALQQEVPNFTTTSEHEELRKLGFTKYEVQSYVATDSIYLRRGDILCTASKGHTVIVIDDASTVDLQTNNGGTITTTIQFKSKFGYDISHHQGQINWDTMANHTPHYKTNGVLKSSSEYDNLGFVIIRCGYTGGNDTRFIENAKAAISKGIPWGTYLYSYATTQTKTNEDATRTLERIKAVKDEMGDNFVPPFGVFLDMEDKSIASLGKTKLTDFVISYCQQIESAGYKAGCYANANWFKNYVDIQTLRSKNYLIWLASWNTNSSPPTVKNVVPDIWQRSGGSDNIRYLGSYAGAKSTNIDSNLLINTAIASNYSYTTTTTSYVEDSVDNTDRIKNEGFMHPLGTKTYRLTSPYGKRSSGFHGGVDYAGAYPGETGVKIYAAASGIVTRAEYSSSYGYVIYITHKNGYQTRYAHCVKDSFQVKKGDAVLQGTYLAVMGTTGNSSGIHLHFEIRKFTNSNYLNESVSYQNTNGNSTTLNPESYISRKTPYKITASVPDKDPPANIPIVTVKAKGKFNSNGVSKDWGGAYNAPLKWNVNRTNLVHWIKQ